MKNTGKNLEAGLAGAVIGAGVAVAANKILSDKETQKKVGRVMHDIKGKVSQTVEKVKEGAERLKDQASEKVDEAGREMKKKARK